MTKREEFEAALRAYGAVGYDARYARVLALYDEAEKRVEDLELDWKNEINSLAAKLDQQPWANVAERRAEAAERREEKLRDMNDRLQASLVLHNDPKTVTLDGDYFHEMKAERDALAARCEELAKRNTDGEEQRLADEQTIRNLTKRYDALAATLERVKAWRAYTGFKDATLDAALAPQREKE